MRRGLPKTMRARLAVLFALSTSIILAVSGTLLYRVLVTSTAHSLTSEMQSSLRSAVAHVAAAKTWDELRAGGIGVHAVPDGHEHLDFAILDRSDNVIVKSDGFKGEGAERLIRPDGASTSTKDADRGLRYLAAAARLGDKAASEAHIVIQGDYRSTRAFLRLCATCIALATLGGTLVAAVVAHRIAAFALKPLAELAACADEISTSRLAHPLPDRFAAGELLDLSHAFNRMLVRLNESFTRLTQFSSDLAHDIRTPLTNLLAQAQVALAQPRSNEAYRAVIESSVEELQRLSHMIDDMLLLARIDAGQRNARLQRLAGEREALRVARYYESIGEDRDIKIRVEGRCSFFGEPLLVERAICNLVSNACAHAPAASTVTLECREERDTAIIRVVDRGPGIAREHLTRIFDRFYRVDPARHNPALGTGLGLAIVKSIMHEHGGDCHVESEPGVGTAFSLRFPTASPAGGGAVGAAPNPL
jgi:two-component system heavy metal sensor histidine kinase CusS